VRSLLKEQNSFEAAMHVARMGSRTGSRPVRKSFGMSSAFGHTLSCIAVFLLS